MPSVFTGRVACVALSVYRFTVSLQKLRLLCSPRVSRDTWHRGKGIEAEVHGFSRKHDSSWDLRGRRANPAIARSFHCA